MTHAIILDMEDETERAMARDIAPSMYLGERCRFCGRIYETLDDLRGTVYAGYHEHGRLACGTCYEAQPPEVIEALKAAAREEQ